MKDNETLEEPRNPVSVVSEPESRLTVARQAAPPDALTDFGKVDVGLELATEIANKLRAVIVEKELSVSMGGTKEHLTVEAWVTCGMMVGVSPKTEWTQEVRNPTTGELEGYKARVQAIRMATGAVIGAAESSCHFDEQNKRRDTGELYERWLEHGRPNRHAAMSMAQTRATSKALAQALRWIPVLAGYSGTPFEEMPPGGVGNGDGPKSKTSSRGSKPTASGGKSRGNMTTISDAMAKRAVAIARSQGQKIKPEVHGFDVVADMLVMGKRPVQPDGSRYPELIAHLVEVISLDAYDAFCAAIERYQGPDKPLRGDEEKPPAAGPDEGDGGDTTGPEREEEMVPIADGQGNTKMVPIRCAVEHVDEDSGEIFYTEAPF